MQLETWTIQNQTGNKAKILNLGARLIHWESSVTNGKNVIVGYKDIESYRNDVFYMGAIAGPYANRIANAKVTTSEGEINLGANEGNNHLHGGNDGLQNVFWQLKSRTDNSVILEHTHNPSDDHIGYPGRILFTVTYEVSEEGTLSISMAAESEEEVPIGPTGHAYFNLGNMDETIDGHVLKLEANQYTPFGEQNLPTGEISDVSEEFDFTEAKAVEVVLDNNFVANGLGFRKVATLTSPVNLVAMDVFSDYPGVQVYTADHLGGEHFGRQAICIEPQFYPDAPNQESFPFDFTSTKSKFAKQIQYCLKSTA